MNKTEIENRYSKHQLTITSIDDFSDEIEFTYFKEKAKEVVTASLIVDLRNETPEQKLAYFFSSIESAKSQQVKKYNKEIEQLKGDWRAQAKAGNLYLNIMKMRELCPELDIDDYEIITDEEIEFFEQFKSASTSFTALNTRIKHENQNLKLLIGEIA